MVLSVEIHILKSYRVYNSINDVDDPDMKISLASNALNECVATLPHITPHWKAVMVISEVWTVYLPVLYALAFTEYTVYYSDNFSKY